MEIDLDLVSAERTMAARQLINTAQADGIVPLTVLGGMDLCILGGPKQPVFPEAVAGSWINLSDRARMRLIDDRTADLVNRGMLVKNSSTGYTYTLSPEVGIVLAARCRPAFVVTAGAGPHLRPLSFFALGDQDESMRGLVVETPTALSDATRKHHSVKRLGPLGWLYTYALLNPQTAAHMLTDWAAHIPPGTQPGSRQPPYVIVLFRAGDGLTPAVELSVVGDGTTARVTGTGIDGEFDKEGLKQLMLWLIEQGTPAD